MAAKLTRQTQTIVTLWHLVAEIVLRAILGLGSEFRKFWYAFMVLLIK